MIRHQHTQNTVPQKFQSLIAHQRIVIPFVGIGGMGQCILQQGNIIEMIADGGFQILNH